uniref:Aminopeptidase n=1 Tax=Electrophorus electricus TaxID=8005 RepID=A0A4W4H380_ELEEL
MAKGVYISKALAIATIVLTVSAVCGIVLMVILYQMQIEKKSPVRPPSPVPTTPLPTGPPPTLRLPKNLIPESYKIYIQPFLYTKLNNVTEQSYFFKGNSTVRLKCVKDTRSIFLHAAFLSVTHVVVTHSDTQKEIDYERYQVQNETNFFEILLKDALIGNGSYYNLFTVFEGELHDDLAGLYSSQYTEKVDEESQMQPTDARRVFPCFDEPDMKAVFNITVIHRDGTTALSNTKGKTIVYEAFLSHQLIYYSWIATTFDPTPVMSTYLLAFTVTVQDFGRKSDKHDTKEIKIWARPEAVAAGHANYAMEITLKILEYYENLFKMKYQLNKLDQIAVPDFSGSGMENWGLVMYRESALLYEEGVSSASNKEFVATVVAHELAHQWFGNLVTMKWWNNLWLNEGLATFLSYFGVNYAEPMWNIKDLIILKEIRVAMEVDCLNSSHPLSLPESEVEDPDDIAELFDGITYSKVSLMSPCSPSVLRLETYQIHNEGVSERMIYGDKGHDRYNQHMIRQSILLPYQDTNTHKDVVGIMKTWTEQPGYPVITINTSTGMIHGVALLSICSIPLVRVPAYEIKDDAWLLANVNCTGYYRVNYDEQNWNKLIHQLESNHPAIPLISRGQLIDDAFNLARAKYINVTLALTTTKYLINETDYVPWESALKNLRYFMLMFDRSEVYGPMQKYLHKQIAPLYEYFKKYTDNMTVPLDLADQYNQINAISVACSNGVLECTQLNFLFQHSIPPNLKSTIYCNAIAAGDEHDWDFAWEKYDTATIATMKDDLRYGLSCTKKIWLLNRYLGYTLDHNKIRKMDAASTITYIAKNVAGQALAWDFIRAHWTYISQEDFQQVCSEDGSCVAKRALEQVIERTEANIKWVKENKQTVLNWFVEQSKVL